jgi:hypothetical protein
MERPSKQARKSGPPLAVQHAGGYAASMDSPLFMPVLQVGVDGVGTAPSGAADRRSADRRPPTAGPCPQVEPSPTTGMTNIIPPLFQQQQPVVKRAAAEPVIEQQRVVYPAGPPPIPIAAAVSCWFRRGCRTEDGRAEQAVVGPARVDRPRPTAITSCYLYQCSYDHFGAVAGWTRAF